MDAANERAAFLPVPLRPFGELTELRALALGPAMTLWGSSFERSLRTTPRPNDAPRAYATGPDPRRVLIFGAGPAVGWGVRSHDLALPGALARALSAATGRGTDVEVSADPEINVDGALERLLTLPLWRYDAIVIVLGVNDALKLTPLDLWQRQFRRLLAGVEGSVSPGTQIAVTGIHPLRSTPVFDSRLGGVAARHANGMNDVTEGICLGSKQTTFTPLTTPGDPAPGRHRDPSVYAHWARLIAASLAPANRADRDAGTGHPASDPTEWRIDEQARQSAVDEMGLAANGPNERLDHIVAIARRALRTDSALVTILDRDRQLSLATSGSDLREIPRSSSFCDAAILTRDGMVVPDARADDRFSGNPLVVGSPRLRFYAGFPIESPSGERVGALCVFDPSPRSVADVDMVFLRELAMLVQTELAREDRASQSTRAEAQ